MPLISLTKRRDVCDEEERRLSAVQWKRSRDKIPYITEKLRFEEFTHRAISSLKMVHISE